MFIAVAASARDRAHFTLFLEARFAPESFGAVVVFHTTGGKGCYRRKLEGHRQEIHTLQATAATSLEALPQALAPPAKRMPGQSPCPLSRRIERAYPRTDGWDLAVRATNLRNASGSSVCASKLFHILSSIFHGFRPCFSEVTISPTPASVRPYGSIDQAPAERSIEASGNTPLLVQNRVFGQNGGLLIFIQ